MREIEREKKEKPFGRQDIVLILLGSLYIFLFCWIGSYARPSADDYNFFEAVSDSGFIEVQKLYYCQWTGRVFNTFLLSLAASLDAGSFYGLLSPVTVLLSVMALYFCLGALVPGGSVRDKMVFVLLLQAAMLSVLPAQLPDRKSVV